MARILRSADPVTMVSIPRGSVLTAPVGPSASMVVGALGLVGVALYSFALNWSMNNTDYDIWGGVLIAPVLIGLTIPLSLRVARAEADPRLTSLILMALICKLFGALLSYVVAFQTYDGIADAAGYVRWGKEFAELLSVGIWPAEGGPGGAGTIFIRYVTGMLFTVIGPTALGGFLVYTWLSFWGLYLFYRAYRLAVPEGDPHRYALLMFFLPTMLFWTSSVGKEAWMAFVLGVCAYGIARTLTQSRGGFLLTALGLAGVAAVRPHMSALVCAALVPGFLLRRSKQHSILGPVGKVVGALVIIAGLLYVVEYAERRFGVEDQGLAGAERVIDQASERTQRGSSQYAATRPDSLLDIPLAAFSVMFRPLPHEAHNVQALASSFEGVGLLALFALSWRRLKALPQAAWRSPYLTFAVTYSLLFIVAFSSFGNFGILVRQRSQLFPMVLLVLAVKASRAPRSAMSARN